MEINEQVLTLLTPEGEFLQAHKQQCSYEIGQEISFIPIMHEESAKGRLLSFLNNFRGRAIAALASAFMVLAASFFLFLGNQQVYAYMSIDINPSIELGVNDKLQVIEITPYNEEGKKVISELDDWKKENIDIVLSKIFKNAKEEGYISSENRVVIGTVRTGEVKTTVEEKLELTMNNIEETIEKEKAVFITKEATLKEREVAKEKGVTVGKYVEKEKEEKKEKTAPNNKKQNNSNKPVDKTKSTQNPGTEKGSNKSSHGSNELKLDKSNNSQSGNNGKGNSEKDKSMKDNQKNTEQTKTNKPSKPVNNGEKNSQDKKNNGNNNSSKTGKENSQNKNPAN